MTFCGHDEFGDAAAKRGLNSKNLQVWTGLRAGSATKLYFFNAHPSWALVLGGSENAGPAEHKIRGQTQHRIPCPDRGSPRAETQTRTNPGPFS